MKVKLFFPGFKVTLGGFAGMAFIAIGYDVNSRLAGSNLFQEP